MIKKSGSNEQKNTPFIFTSHRLVSLLAMLNEFDFLELKILLSGMQAISVELEEIDETALEETYKDDLLMRVIEYERICRTYKIDIASCVSRLNGKIQRPARFRRPISAFWMELRNRIGDEMEKHLFMYLQASESQYYNNKGLFGDDVYKSFKLARDEIKEAGNCYALGLYTACVFHLMRAVEVALQKMIVAMKAQQHLKKTIELCTWDELIKGLRTALGKMENGKSTSLKVKATHAFYSEAISTFTEFKDAWRNTISHGHEIDLKRKLFKPGETEDIMNSTRHFMRHLTKRIKGRSRDAIENEDEYTERW